MARTGCRHDTDDVLYQRCGSEPLESDADDTDVPRGEKELANACVDTDVVGMSELAADRQDRVVQHRICILRFVLHNKVHDIVVTSACHFFSNVLCGNHPHNTLLKK